MDIVRFIFVLCLLVLFSNAACAAGKITVPVVVAGENIFQAHMTPDMRADAAEFSNWVHDNMNAQSSKNFDALVAQDGMFSINQTAAAGFALSYDDANGVLHLSPLPQDMKENIYTARAPQFAAGDKILKPASLSGFLNLRGGEDDVQSSTAGDGRQPLRLDLDGAINKNGWVLESRGGYLEGAPQSFARSATRLVHDLPDKMVRVAVGDLSYPVDGFQSYQPMLGVSIARDFSLQPYRVTAPTGQTSFVLRSSSRVGVIVNGQKMRTLQLPAGSYSIADFPVADGGNDVSLVITDAAGNVERRDFPLISDRQLLKKGLHAYAYNLGVESETDGRTVTYQLNHAVVSAFHRYGVTDTLTMGASAQADVDVQQAGVSVLRAFKIGTIGFDVSASHARAGGAGGAVQASYHYHDLPTQRDFSAQATYRTAQFSALGRTMPVAATPAENPLNPAALEIAMRYSQPIFRDVNMGIGGRYRFGRGTAPDDWSYAATFTKTVSRAITLTLSAEQRRMDGAGVFASITWSPPTSRQSVMASVDTLSGVQQAEWHMRANRDVGAFDASAGVSHDKSGTAEGTGSIDYKGYRGEASFTHDLAAVPGGGTQERSEVLFGTALAYAGGHFAVTRPITGSFVMLPAYKNLSGDTVGVNAASAETHVDYQAEADSFSAAVLPDVTPYMYRPVKIDTRSLPVGYDIGRDTFTAFPTYKSGTVMVIGSAENIYADGYLHLQDGTVAALQGGQIKRLDDKGASPQEFFTNAQGRFRISRLAPGRYALSLYREAGAAAQIDIPDTGTAGRFNAGTLTLEAAR